MSRVLRLLEAEKFAADIRKCKFFIDEVEFCGQILGHGTRRPAPGKLLAIEKWELPQTITALRAFLGFTNYYHTYVHMYAELAAPLQEKLKVPRSEGKKGSKKKIEWSDSDIRNFEEIKKRLCTQLSLQIVNPDKPFVLRVDASQYAVGATLEQIKEGDEVPTVQHVMEKKTVPVAFMSRKLATGQRNWTPREIETYAIVLALQKWESWIGLQPVLVLTDHQAIEAWAKEVLDAPSGPVGRRSRWHQIFSKFDLSVGYIPGKDNQIADILSRWAYLASQALRDISKHGSTDDDQEMREMIEREKEEENECMYVCLRHQPCRENLWIRGVTTRSGRRLTPQEGLDGRPEEGAGDVGLTAGTNTQMGQHLPTPGEKSVVTFDGEEEIIDEAGNITRRKIPDIDTAGNELGTTEEGKEGPPSSSPPDPEPQSVWERNWGKAYERCTVWKDIWGATQDIGKKWPSKVKVFRDRMYKEERLCIPTDFQRDVIVEQHAFLGHVGTEKLWDHMGTIYEWANKGAAKRFVNTLTENCTVCQACKRVRNSRGTLESTPIPPKIMQSVALDLFHMPAVLWEGQKYDTMVVCVDRHSGWMVAVPCLNQGLTGAKVAKLMIQNQWRPFGVPSVITSDQGSHFVSAWWQNMCALMGIGHAFSQAYHHQANVWAEMAGQQLMKRLNKLYIEEKINWVECLPQVVDRLHDVKGVSGLSPYEILFGRQRPLGNIPYTPVKECEDAQVFFQRMKEVDTKVAQVLNDLHEQQSQRANLDRQDSAPFAVGDVVWYRRPPNSGDKLDSRWIGPGKVIAREGEKVMKLK